MASDKKPLNPVRRGSSQLPHESLLLLLLANQHWPSWLQPTGAERRSRADGCCGTTVAVHSLPQPACPARRAPTAALPRARLLASLLLTLQVWGAIKPFVNGGAAGMLSTCVMQPVDMVKVRIQLGEKGNPVSRDQ